MIDKQTQIEIESLIEKGLVTIRKHPDIDIWILNYTHSMQYKNAWTPVAEQCRGLIVDSEWSIVARPFRKFYNLGEKMNIEDLPAEIPLICEKLDGFMGIMYYDNGKPAITTRGTFESPMAIWATEYIRNQSIHDFLEDYTYIFEIIEPALCREQGLVVDYGDRAECVLLAVIETATGLELDHIEEAMALGLPYAREFNGSLKEAVHNMPTMGIDDGEGFVCRYSNGLRIKLKSDVYKRLNRLMHNTSPKHIIRIIIDDGNQGINDMLKDIPDEMYDNIREIVDNINNTKDELITKSRALCDSVEDMPSMQDKAKVVSASPVSDIAFAMLRGKDYDMVALKHVRRKIGSDDTFIYNSNQQ